MIPEPLRGRKLLPAFVVWTTKLLTDAPLRGRPRIQSSVFLAQAEAPSGARKFVGPEATLYSFDDSIAWPVSSQLERDLLELYETGRLSVWTAEQERRFSPPSYVYSLTKRGEEVLLERLQQEFPDSDLLVATGSAALAEPDAALATLVSSARRKAATSKPESGTSVLAPPPALM